LLVVGLTLNAVDLGRQRSLCSSDTRYAVGNRARRRGRWWYHLFSVL